MVARASRSNGRERAAFLDLARHKSYFVWLERSLMEIYGLEAGIDCGNWDELSRRIAAAYSDRNGTRSS